MSRTGALLAASSRSAALILAGFSLITSPIAATAAECPDAPTVSAARLLEFKTMMMVVGLRCKSVGVLMADHSDQMAALRSTMFDEANRRVRRYIYDNDRPEPVAVTPAPPVATATVAAAAAPKARVPLRARGKGRGGRGLAKGRGRVAARGAGKMASAGHAAAPAKAPAAPVAAPATAPVAAAPAKVPAKGQRAGLVKAAPSAAKPAPRSRREDPYEMYLTRVGTTYGMGDNSLGTCRRYDALVSYLGDPTTPNRALTMAAEGLVPSTMLERQRSCPADGKR
jgi:hypothetical protein